MRKNCEFCQWKEKLIFVKKSGYKKFQREEKIRKNFPKPKAIDQNYVMPSVINCGQFFVVCASKKVFN